MYKSLAAKTGVKFVNDTLATMTVQSGPDGLTLNTASFAMPAHAGMSDRLRSWLFDIRVLRNLPLAYLVPDEALLPTESIRFFNVDPTWVDRVTDGVFSAANTGTVDFAFSVALMQLVRESLDDDLVAKAKESAPATAWTPATGPVTGMLIRSELVTRWPDMIVRAFTAEDRKTPVGILRAEPISKDILIALFAGDPGQVEIREPHVGVRFGVEQDDKNQCTGDYKVDKKDTNGNEVANQVVCILLKSGRVINVADLATKVGSPRMVALHLEQLAYVQEFKKSIVETRGSVPISSYALDPNLKVKLSSGRYMDLTSLVQKQAMIADLEKH